MKLHNRSLIALGSCLFMLTAMAQAVEIRIKSLDAGTASGLDDPTPAAPVGGNPGKTRGEQARIVYEFAASLWSAVLKNPVQIDIDASFEKLDCTQNDGAAGSVSSTIIEGQGVSPSGESVYMRYGSALNKALHGASPGGFPGFPELPGFPGIDSNPADISMAFNGAAGTPGCLENRPWYFGLDGHGEPGQIDLLNTVLHEITHGMGVPVTDEVFTGELKRNWRGEVTHNPYAFHVFDNVLGKHWYEMSDTERRSAVLNDGHLVFTGPHVTAEAPLALGMRDELRVGAPAGAAGEYAFNQALFGPPASVANFSGAVVRVVTGSTAQGCSAFDNAAAVAGHLALVDRDGCDDIAKARFAEKAGATGLIIVDSPNAPLPFPRAPRDDGGVPVNLPVLAISRLDGDTFQAHLNELRIAMRTVPAGRDASGYVQLFAPKTLSISSYVHFDSRLSPDALMEPRAAERPHGHIDLDLTPALLRDLGWTLHQAGQRLGYCDTGVPAWVPGGVVVGANLVATARMLAGASANAGDYAVGMRAHAAKLADDGLLSAAQVSSLNACLSEAELARQYASWREGGSGEPPLVELDSGKTLTNQSGAAGSERTYLLVVPPGARALNIRSFGGTGDTSLLVKLGNEPTAASYDYRSVHPGNSESVGVARPAAGSYLIRVVGDKAYSGMYVQATYNM